MTEPLHTRVEKASGGIKSKRHLPSPGLLRSCSQDMVIKDQEGKFCSFCVLLNEQERRESMPEELRL